MRNKTELIDQFDDDFLTSKDLALKPINSLFENVLILDIDENKNNSKKNNDKKINELDTIKLFDKNKIEEPFKKVADLINNVIDNPAKKEDEEMEEYLDKYKNF